LQCQHANTISYGMTLDSLVRPRRALQSGTSSGTNENKPDDMTGAKATASSSTRPAVADTAVQDIEDEVEYLQSIRSDLTHLGSMLFSRCVSGTRVVPRNVTNKIGTSTVLTGFGSSCDDYPRAYLTAACAIGMNASEMHEFFHRLDKTLREHKRKLQKQKR
jgi:hypothetical protein